MRLVAITATIFAVAFLALSANAQTTCTTSTPTTTIPVTAGGSTTTFYLTIAVAGAPAPASASAGCRDSPCTAGAFLYEETHSAGAQQRKDSGNNDVANGCWGGVPDTMIF